MKCDEARNTIPLFLYNELSFDDEDRFEAHIDECDACRRELAREKLLHRSFDEVNLDVTPDFLTSCRKELFEHVQLTASHRQLTWATIRDMLNFRWHVPSVLQPVGALALIAVGFLGAHLIPANLSSTVNSAGLAAIPVESKVRYVEPEKAGKVEIVVEETQQKTITGSVEDAEIQKLLLAAATDPNDPGVRVESVDALKSRPESSQVRDMFLYVLQHDSNAGVRLKALDGLKSYASDPEVRQALARVLLTDNCPGVRTQVIDLLIQHNEQQMAGVLQELMRKEENSYVRMRCQRALHEMRASVGTF